MKLKQQPEDFVVNEITNVVIKESGQYCYFWLEKRNYNTIDAVDKVKRILGVKKIGFAGSKDRHAITRQLCSARGVSRKQIEDIDLHDITLSFYGFGDTPVSLGDLEGNDFKIVVRDLREDEVEKVKDKKIMSIVNYFDEQRFSTDNVAIGRAMVKKDFKGAVKLLCKKKSGYNALVGKYLEDHAADYIGAIRIVPRKILMFFVHAYQSWLWNEMVAELIGDGSVVQYSLGKFVFGEVENRHIPVLGFGSEIENSELNSVIKNLLGSEDITIRDFIIREIPEVSCEGTSRSLVVDVKDFVLSVEDDKLHKGKKKVTLQFMLPKGSYATIVVKKLFA
jgi:tRNA pseudouridine13 synthase